MLYYINTLLYYTILCYTNTLLYYTILYYSILYCITRNDSQTMPKSRASRSSLRQAYVGGCWDIVGLKMLQYASKMVPVGAKMVKLVQDGSQRLPRTAKIAQVGPKVLVPRGPKLAPRWPKLAPRWPKFAPRGPQEAPRLSKRAPRWPKLAPLWPKLVQSWPKFAPTCHTNY